MQAIDLGHRGHGAVEGAVEALERPPAVGGGAVGLDAEAALECPEEIAAALHAAGYTHADTRHAAARRGQTELGIVRGDAVHLAQRHAQVRGHGREGVGRDPALRVLDGLQRGQEPGALSGELAEIDHGATTARTEIPMNSRKY